jgi:hypothetical protein
VKAPINRCRVYSFAPTDASLTVSVSADGKNYVPATVNRLAFPSSQTVYGYLTPILFAGEIVGREAIYLRIENSTNSTGASPHTAIELARVEIEYGRTATTAAAAPQRVENKAAQLSASVFVDSVHPLDETLQAINAAAQHGERQTNVVVTIYVDLTDDLQIKSFGEFAGPDRAYKPFDNVMRRELKEKLRQVFARMVKHGMAIYVLPHIDAGGKVKKWRNWVNFDPLQPYSGYSYAELLLGTIADALAEAAAPDTRIEMALSGEMGTSLFRYPESYRTVVRQLRARPALKQLKLGISLNHGGIAGARNPTGAKDLSPADEKRQQMQGLIEDCDFVGMSFYAPISVSPTPDDFVRGIERFMAEFKQYGLTVPTNKPMQFSEVGIGGRRLRNDENPDLTKAVAAPWEGTASTRNNPWRDESLRLLRRQYHRALLQFLETQPAQWRVSAAFVWSMGSWDPVGLRQPEFADPEIIAAIEKHNRKVPNE